jgi:6-phosphogluconate dehydrogenase (decarboxylating)
LPETPAECPSTECAAAAAAAARYENTERRKAKVEALGLRYMGMGVSGGEEGARRGALSTFAACFLAVM